MSLDTTYHTDSSFIHNSQQSISERGNLILCSEQSGKTHAAWRENQTETDLEIQGDQMVALLVVEAVGIVGMKARSVFSWTG